MEKMVELGNFQHALLSTVKFCIYFIFKKSYWLWQYLLLAFFYLSLVVIFCNKLLHLKFHYSNVSNEFMSSQKLVKKGFGLISTVPVGKTVLKGSYVSQDLP